MIRPHYASSATPAALLRLSRLAPLSERELALLAAAAANSQTVQPRRELMTEGKDISGPKLLLSGWAARARILPDGRRQFLSFVLPGDLIGFCRHARPLSISSIVTLTEIAICSLPPTPASTGLAEAYAISAALEEAHLLSQITRLGRLSAQERIGDLMLELHERLTLAGLVSNNSFELPLTQETLADALGLTSVHVNRMLQLMRRDGDVQWRSGRLTVPNPAVLARKVGRTPVRVSGAG